MAIPANDSDVRNAKEAIVRIKLLLEEYANLRLQVVTRAAARTIFERARTLFRAYEHSFDADLRHEFSVPLKIVDGGEKNLAARKDISSYDEDKSKAYDDDAERFLASFDPPENKKANDGGNQYLRSEIARILKIYLDEATDQFVIARIEEAIDKAEKFDKHEKERQDNSIMQGSDNEKGRSESERVAKDRAEWLVRVEAKREWRNENKELAAILDSRFPFSEKFLLAAAEIVGEEVLGRLQEDAGAENIKVHGNDRAQRSEILQNADNLEARMLEWLRGERDGLSIVKELEDSRLSSAEELDKTLQSLEHREEAWKARSNLDLSRNAALTIASALDPADFDAVMGRSHHEMGRLWNKNGFADSVRDARSAHTLTNER